MTGVHICRPSVVTTRKVLRGDTWAEGERMRRPFRRGWRAEASAKAKRDWEQATPVAEFRAALRQMVEAAL